MTIAKRPSKQTADEDKEAKTFIANAGKAPASDIGKIPVLFRFRHVFLERMDAAAKKHELPRQAWVRTVIARELEAEGF